LQFYSSAAHLLTLIISLFPREKFCEESADEKPCEEIPPAIRNRARSSMKCDSGKLLLAVDIAGTFLFGIEGADAAIRRNLDLLGLMVLAFWTALAGGVVRDPLIGAVPPEAIRDWRYATTAFAARSSRFSFTAASQRFLVQS
jgi:hypothetical protein